MKNVSASPIQIALLSKLNLVPLEIMSKPERFSVRTKIVNAILATFPVNKVPKKVDKSQFEERVDPNWRSECEWLEKNFGISFDFAESKKKGNLDDYFDKLLSTHADYVSAVFQKTGYKFNSNRTLVQNFNELYFDALSTPSTTKFDKSFQFDPHRYLRLNPDVAAAKMNPYEHFLRFGLREGREY